MSDRFPDFAYYYQPAHFALLTVAAETGLVGGMAYGALMVVPFCLLWWRRRELTPELIGVSGALLALTRHRPVRLLHLEAGARAHPGSGWCSASGSRPTRAGQRQPRCLT